MSNLLCPKSTRADRKQFPKKAKCGGGGLLPGPTLESCREWHPKNFGRSFCVAAAQGGRLQFPCLSQSALPAKPLLPCTFKGWEKRVSAEVPFLRSRTGFSSSALRPGSHGSGERAPPSESLFGNGVGGQGCERMNDVRSAQGGGWGERAAGPR